MTLLWEEYQAEFSDQQTYRYTQFCEHYKSFTKRLKRSYQEKNGELPAWHLYTEVFEEADVVYLALEGVQNGDEKGADGSASS